MKLFFLGVGPGDHAGHFLHDQNLQKIWSSRQENELPFRYTILDGGLLPPGRTEEQGRIHRSEINGWTVISMWDRSADQRGQSCAAFVAEGVWTINKMVEICSAQFAKVWNRIKPFHFLAKIPGEAAQASETPQV